MKKIEAIIKPFHLGEIKTALEAMDGIQNFIATDVCCFSGGIVHKAQYRNIDYEIDFYFMVKVEVIANNTCARHTSDVLQRFSAPTQNGGGAAVISNIERTIPV